MVTYPEVKNQQDPLQNNWPWDDAGFSVHSRTDGRQYKSCHLEERLHEITVKLNQ